MLSLSLGAIRRLFIVLLPLKWFCIPTLPKMLLTNFVMTLGIGKYHTDVVVVVISAGVAPGPVY